MTNYTKTMREALSEVKAVEAHECEKAHPNMSHIEWVAQTKDAKNQDKKVGVFPIDDDAWIDIGQWAEYQQQADKL